MEPDSNLIMPTTCAEPLRVVPGPMGPAGTNGSNGTNGADAFTTLTANFTVPAVGATAVATVGSTAWMVVGQPLFIQNGGVFYVTAIGGATSVTLQNPAAETGNVAPATVVATANKVSPSGFKGAAGSTGSGGTGVTVATKGDIQTFAGAPANLGVGTNGQILRSLSSAGTGLDWEQIVPNAGSAADDNKIAIANCPLGTETPANLQFTLAKVTDTGAYQTVGGNARGVDAVDQQPARSAATEVASGNNSGILSGRNNTASGQGAVAAGETNVASGANAVAMGAASTASDIYTVAIGLNNTASGQESVAIGGNSHLISGAESAALGGNGSVIDGQGSFAAAGNFLLGHANYSFLAGSLCVTDVGADYSVATGLRASATLHAQRVHSAGPFASPGDSQLFDLIWRRSTTDATANQEMWLDGTAIRATIPLNTTWSFRILLTGRASTGVSAAWEVVGAIMNNAGVVTLPSAVTTTVISDGTGATWGVAANFVVDADDPNNALRLRVTGAAATSIRWTANARLVAVGHS